MKAPFAIVSVGLVGIVLGMFARGEQQPDKETEASIIGASHFVERDGQRIHVWSKAPEDWDASLGRVIVFMHGGTYSGRPDFDLAVEDYSVMDAFVRRGWATYAVDAQGYGASDNPKEESWSSARDAAQDLEVAVKWICKQRKVPKVSLLGWSWGCQVVGEFAQNNPARVQSVILQGASFETKYEMGELQNRFRSNDAQGAASDFIEGCFEQHVVDAYLTQCLLHDPDSPNGVLRDFAIGSTQVLKPETWTWPTLIVLGEHEAKPERQRDMANFYLQLKSKRKAMVQVPGGGHAVLLERPHLAWQGLVADFLAYKD